MKLSAPIALFALMSCSVHGSCSESECVFGAGVISFDVTGDQQAKPLKRLVKALKENPTCPAIRIIWGISDLNTSTDATVLYRRKVGRLSYFSRQNVSGLGNENLGPGTTHCVFYKVKDWMLLDLAKRHIASPGASKEDSFFGELTRYGCRRVSIREPVFKKLKTKSNTR